MDEKEKIKKLAKKLDNTDTLITFGDEAITFRKDDKRSVKALKNMKEDNKKKRIEAIKSDEVSLFYGINLSNTRADNEDHKQYKDRLKTNKDLERIYKMLGRDEAKKQFPEGFAYAIHAALGKNEENNNNKK